MSDAPPRATERTAPVSVATTAIVFVLPPSTARTGRTARYHTNGLLRSFLVWSAPMAGIKVAYIGGGSTRAPGTMAAWMEQGAAFAGSEIVLIDLDAERLELVRTLAEKMVRKRGLDITVTATTDRRAGLDGCDAVLSSYRPG